MGLIGPHRVDGPIMLVEYLEIEHPTWRDLETDRTILVNRHDAVDLLDGQRTCDAGDGGPWTTAASPQEISVVGVGVLPLPRITSLSGIVIV